MSKITATMDVRKEFGDLVQSDKRWAIAVAHRRAGKTVACVQRLLTKAAACKLPDPRFAYVAPLYNQAKDVAWSYLKRLSTPVLAQFNESELRADLPNGARIRLYGADNPDRLRGLYFDGVILDEYADMRPSVWGEVIRPMLADRRGWATFIGTPKGHNEFYELWQRAQADENWFHLILKASETGLLSQEELIDAAKGMSENAYAQEFECSFEAAIQGAYFAVQMRKLREDNRIGHVPLDPNKPVHTCWDIGKSDLTAIWFFQAHGQMVHLVDYYENSGEGVEFYARHLRELKEKRQFVYGRHYGPHDLDNSHWVLPAERAIRDVARSVGIDFLIVPRVTNKLDAIEAGRNWLSMCWIDQEHCAKGIEALDHYRAAWDDDRKTWRNKPEHDWASHGADALMTGACGFTPDYIPPPTDRYARARSKGSAWAA